MKRLLITIFILATLIALALSPAFGAVTNTLTGLRPTSYWWTGEPLADRALLQARELEVLLGATAGTATASKALILSANAGTSALVFTPTDVAPTTTEGQVYYHESDECLKLRTSTDWVDIDVSGASSLGVAYGIASTITLTDAQDDVSIVCPDDTVSQGPLLLLDNNEDTDDISSLQIDDEGAGVCIEIDGGGYDIQGTGDVWSIDHDGLAVLVGLTIGAEDLALENGAEIQNVVDTELRFLEDNGVADEDIIFDFGTDVINLKSGTGVVSIDFGAVDSLIGINAIAFDAAVANTITQTGTGDADDLTISQAGTVDVSLILSSAGSIGDALSLITTDAVGSIKVNSSDNLDIDAADNVTIDTADGSYTLTIAGGTYGDYIMTAADTASMISVDNFHVGSTAGSITIEAEEDAANAVLITADGSTLTTMKLHNDTGTDDESIYLASDVGGITLNAAAGSIDIEAVGGDAGDLLLSAGDVMTLTSADTKIFDGAAAETWIIEGTANAHEATVVFTDPTADVTYTFPVMAEDIVSLMLSTLATNAPDIENSVTGGTNQLIFEGSVDAHETILTATDATADATLTLPDDTGYFAYIAEAGTTTKDATDADLPLTDAVVIGTSDATSSWGLPNGEEGQILTVVIGTDGGVATITPATAAGCGWATVVLTDDAEGVTFLYVNDTVGWIILGTFSDGTNIVEVTQ